MVNAAGLQPATSSQRSGVDTGAFGFGRTEYTDAIVFPSPFWFESISTPRRRAFDHSVVASFGCARAIALRYAVIDGKELTVAKQAARTHVT